MDTKLRKQVGQLKPKEALKRLYPLCEFFLKYGNRDRYAKNLKPIRRVVGRSLESRN